MKLFDQTWPLRVKLPTPETLMACEIPCLMILWHYKVHHFQEFWEKKKRLAFPKTGQGRRDEKGRREQAAERLIGRLHFVLDFWAALLVAAGCLFHSASLLCHCSWELRVKRDPSEDVCLYSTGSAAVEELHLQKETNGKDNRFNIYIFQDFSLFFNLLS